MFLILWYLNIKIKKLLLSVFSFQITLFNDIFINILKNISPTNQITYHHFLKKTRIPNTQLYFFFTFEKTLLEIQYQTHFLHYEYFKYMFLHHFEQQYSNTSTKKALIIYTCYCVCTDPLVKDVIEELIHFIIQNYIH